MKRNIYRRGRRAEERTVSPEALELDAELDEALADSARRPKKKGLRAIFNIRNGVILVCFAVFAVCAVILVNRMIDYRRASEIYDSLAAEMFREYKDEPSVLKLMQPIMPDPALYDYATVLSRGRSEGDVSENTAVVGDIHFMRIKAKLDEIKQINPDIIGWIKQDETEINYPVVLGDDNDYYLTHAYNGEFLRSGTIFADYRCSRTSLLDNKNTVLYGHNMTTGEMFAVLNYYKRRPEIFKNNILIYSFDGIYVYEPVMFLDTDASFYYYRVLFGTSSEFVEYQQKMYEEAVWKSGYELTANDRMLTLSTCSNDSITGRRVLIARLVGVEYKAR